LWGLFRRRKRKELTSTDVAGYTPEERLDMSTIAVELGKWRSPCPAAHNGRTST
jgi:hypothetical protein